MSYLIAAVDEEMGLGRDNTLPWRNTEAAKEDLRYFRQQTSGHMVIMGYATYCSIGKPLPHRRNLVLTSRSLPEVETCANLNEAVERGRQFEHSTGQRCYIIGGAQVYRDYLASYCPREMHICLIPGKWQCDRHFPMTLANLRPGLNILTE